MVNYFKKSLHKIILNSTENHLLEVFQEKIKQNLISELLIITFGLLRKLQQMQADFTHN